jgi:hypothetical protein
LIINSASSLNLDSLIGMHVPHPNYNRYSNSDEGELNNLKNAGIVSGAVYKVWRYRLDKFDDNWHVELSGSGGV